jgi:hypothetical protein
MSGKKFWSFSEVADVLGKTKEDVRRMVIEDRTLIAVHVDRFGHATPFLMGGIGIYDVDEDGVLTDPRIGRGRPGFLRIDGKEFARELHDRFLDTIRPNPIDDFLQQGLSDKTPPVIKQLTPEQRRAQWLELVEAEEKNCKRGAQARVARSLGVDASRLSKDINKARKTRTKSQQPNAFTGLVRYV